MSEMWPRRAERKRSVIASPPETGSLPGFG